jgi:acyl-coenzyme A synthetase/AMP-(fatty) acid ligase
VGDHARVVLAVAVGTRIRREIDLDRAHILITAAAAIHPDLVRWLHAFGLPVIELYGQTEVCGPTPCNPGMLESGGRCPRQVRTALHVAGRSPSASRARLRKGACGAGRLLLSVPLPLRRLFLGTRAQVDECRLGQARSDKRRRQ